MPQYEVQFLSGLKAKYTAIAEKDQYTFYLCTDTNELYIGEELITNAAELTAAISRISANESAIANLRSAVDTLNADSSTEGSVRKITADAIAEIVADAPESLDTLKEIADWIATHASDAAAMNSAIVALQELCGTIPVGAQSTNLVDYIAEYLSENGYDPFNVEHSSDVLIIPEEAYSGSRSDTTLSFPRALAVEKKAFWDAESLTSINIPLAQTIADKAFESCIALTAVNIPSAVYVGEDAYAMCMFASQLNAPVLEYVSDGAFQNNSFTSVDLPCCHHIGMAAFGGSFSLETINIPNVRTLGSGAFQDSHGVEVVKLHKIESIGNNAFYDCPKLKEVYIYTDFVPQAEENIFRQSPMDTVDADTGEIEGKIYVPGRLVDEFKEAAGWSQYANCIVAIPGTEISEELPPATPDDVGKVLKVDASGNWTKGEDNSTIYWMTF